MTRIQTAGLAVVLFVLLCAADAIWLFAFALPQHPSPGPITVPRSQAAASQEEFYEREVDRARLETWEREQIVDSAIVLPIVAVLCVAIAAIVTAAPSKKW